MTKPHPNSPESKARELIDKMVVDAGWTIIREGNPIPNRGNVAVEEVGTDVGPMDYGLFIDGVLVGDIEAKPVGTGVPGIIAQDERYSKGYIKEKFDFDGYHIPFLYASNGHKIQFRDVRSKRNLQRSIEKFHTPDALKEFLAYNIEEALQWLKDHAIDVPGIRPYQKEAIESIENALFVNKRKMLLAMATGTGKTFTAAEMIFRFLKSKTAKRILFLVDRRALAAQTMREFAAFEPEPTQKLDKLYEIYHQRFKREDIGEDEFDPNLLPTEYLQNPQTHHTFVYVCTIQRMRINLFGRQGMFPWTEEDYYEDDVGKIDNIPTNAFDLVIADECHRGYTSKDDSKWREVLDYFDAIKIGLTATPAVHTAAFFGRPIYHYPVERAVREGYLVDWDLIKIRSNIRMKGLFVEEGEEVQYIDPYSGEIRYELLEAEKDYDITSIERKATAPDSNKLIVKEYAKYAREFEKEYGRFPKTIFFAVQDIPHTSHCDMLVEYLSDEFSDKGAGFVQKITGTIDRPIQKIRQFRNQKEPAIAITVDMLSTGVDIPKVEAIVFVRPIRSIILFQQMVGRGTRLENDIGKTHFTILDAVGVVDYMKTVTEFRDPLPAKPTKSYKQIIDEIYNNKDRNYNIKILTRRLQRIAKNISAEGRTQLEPYIENGDIGRFASELKDNVKTNWKETMDILRNPQFQYALENYPQIKPEFVVAIHQEDQVESIHYPIVVHGQEYKPEDYLNLFREFLRKDATKIEAIQILLQRPKDLNTDFLDDLRKKLASAPGQFTEEHLRRAYGNNLVDIIAMIRSAISNHPLLTTRERIQKAMKKISKGKTFSGKEQRWLELIANHLEFNLLIEKRHFATIPFSEKGGWKKADQDFGGSLEEIILQINGVMTA